MCPQELVDGRDDGTFRTIVDTTGALSQVGDPSLNNDGLVAFTGSRFDENSTQIFGISTGDGGAVTTVAEVFSENPETFETRIVVVKATPIGVAAN